MEAQQYWELFCMTGDPLAYMMYRSIQDENDNKMS